MKLTVTKLCIIYIGLIFCSCNDIFLEKEKNILGGISVINPNNQEDKGYKLVFYEKDFNSNVIEDYVCTISGNDSILVVEAVSKHDCEPVFYKVTHDNGKSIQNVSKVSKEVYLSLIVEAHLSDMFSDGDCQVCK